MNTAKLIGIVTILVMANSALHAADKREAAVTPVTPPKAIQAPQKPTPALIVPAIQAKPVATPATVAAPQSPVPALILPAVQAAKPATCAQGFTPIGMKLQKHEGKTWYEYQCVAEQQINRTCNADTEVTAVKDEFISLPSDEQSKKSKLQMSYKCFHYVPVK